GKSGGEYPLILIKSQLREEMVSKIDTLIDLAESYNWNDLLEKIETQYYFIDYCRLVADDSTEPPKLFTPLHFAAEGKAPKEVIEKLIDKGASLTLKSNEGETPYDIAVRQNLPEDVVSLLQLPEDIRMQEDEIKKMEEGLHKTILKRVKDLIDEYKVQLPQVAYMYEKGNYFCSIPMMYGGFHVKDHQDGIETYSFIRICGGSGQMHLIKRNGKVKLIKDKMIV
ncbi:unnamed protein product, partial [Meganyctiphanes norvegica]